MKKIIATNAQGQWLYIDYEDNRLALCKGLMESICETDNGEDSGVKQSLVQSLENYIQEHNTVEEAKAFAENYIQTGSFPLSTWGSSCS